jgi:hypothetical protein
VSATGTALIEFLDDPGVEVFTFGAKVRTSFQSEIPTAGLFAAHRRVADAGADHDFQLEYRFQEAPGSFAVVPPANVPPPDRPRANNVRSFKPVKQVAINVDGWRDFQLFGGPSKRNGGGPKRLDRWVVQPIDVPVSQPMRALAIKADGERFATAWEEKVDDPLAGIPDKDTRALEELLGRRPDPPIRFSARGGLGVYVEGGSVSFRDLVIVPGPSR